MEVNHLPWRNYIPLERFPLSSWLVTIGPRHFVKTHCANQLDEQFNNGTRQYLKQTSEYMAEKNEVSVTSLFSWFRGDFGGKSGVKDILKELEIIPETRGVKISYKNYDWTLDLDNFTKL